MNRYFIPGFSVSAGAPSLWIGIMVVLSDPGETKWIPS